MDSSIPRGEDDLNDLERRLAGWRPGAEGLDAGPMLYAAGVAAGRRGRGRLLWPALCALLAIQAAGLGVWGLAERAERQLLADRLDERARPPIAPRQPAFVLIQDSGPPSLDDYFHLRRQLEQDPDGWLDPPPPVPAPAPGPPPPDPDILQAGQRDRLFDQ
jgi:hypothetical protein